MKTVALITEYNPFHKGHLYHLTEAKKITGADSVIVIMSGNYVQRGTPAVMDKYIRTQMALSCGADFVFLLPLPYACGSAEYFAEGAVSIINHLKCVDSICFGSECGDIKILSEIADTLTFESPEYKSILQEKLKTGMNFAKARENALVTCFPEYENILKSPNNILGIEYLKALKKQKSDVKPFTIKRISCNYHDTALESEIISATALRKVLENNSYDFTKYVPKNIASLYTDNIGKIFPINENDFSSALYLKMLSVVNANKAFNDYSEISEELSNRIIKMLNKYKGFSDFAMLLKNKAYTYTRLSRGLLHILLEIKSDDISEFKANNTVPYNFLLGMKDNEANHALLKTISKNNEIPLISSVKKALSDETLNECAKKMLKTELFADELYNHIIAIKYADEPKNEFTRKFLTS